MHSSYVRPTEDIFNANDPHIKEVSWFSRLCVCSLQLLTSQESKDIISIIMQYLSDEGYHTSQAVLYDETNVKWKEREERTMEAKRLRKAILGKSW